MGPLLAITFAAALGWFAHAWVMKLVGARTSTPLSGSQRTWLSRGALTVGSAAAGLAWVVPGAPLLKVTLVAAGVLGWWLVCVDAAIHRLPDPLVGALAATFTTGYLSLYLSDAASTPDLLRAALAGAVALFGFAVLGLTQRNAMGFGDVKLAGALGIGVGWFGWDVLGQWVLLSFLMGGAYAVLMLITRRMSPKESIAFGPWMILAAAGALALNTIPGVTH